jgi:hypothetical protein
MATQVQLRRGNAAQNDAFTGAVAEITADTTENTIRIHDGSTAGGTALLSTTSVARLRGNIIPATDNVYTLGNATNRFRDLYLAGNSIILGGLTLKDTGGSFAVASGATTILSAGATGDTSLQNLTVTGNLVVSGTSTTVNTETINLADNQIVLNSNHSGAPTQDGGLIVNRGSSANVLLLWDETQDRWEFTNDGTTYYNLATSTTDVAEGTNLYYTNARVSSNVTVLLPEFTGNIQGGNLNITSTLQSTSTTTGALKVAGGAGIAGNVYLGNIFSNQYYWANGSPFSSGGGGGSISLGNEGNVNSSTFYLLMTNNTTSGTITSANVSSSKLYFNPNTGTLNATVFNSLSDIHEKFNVVKIVDATNTINRIDGYEFNWSSTGNKSAGVIAQYIEQVLPHLVDTSDNGTKSVNYSGLIAYLLETVKELDARIKHLESKE